MPDLQVSNRVAVSKVREATFGVTPASPAFIRQRVTSADVDPGVQTVESDEIRSDRQVSDRIFLGMAGTSNLGGELSFSQFDADFEEALQSTWVTQPVITVVNLDVEISDVAATTLTVAAGGAAFKAGHLTLISGMTTTANNGLFRVTSSTATSIVYPASSFTAQAVVNVGTSVRVVGFMGASGDIVATVTGGNALTSTTLDFTTLGIAAGDWVRIGDGQSANSFATTLSNGWCRVSLVAANRLSFDICVGGFAADAGTGKTVRVFFGDRLRNGSTKISNVIERQYLDHSPVSYEYVNGLTCDTLELGFDSKAVVKITRTYKGSTTSISSTRASGATDVAPQTYDVLNTSSNVAEIDYNGSTLVFPNQVTSMTINVNNNLRSQEAITQQGVVQIGNGEFQVTGSLKAYFGSLTLYSDVLANARRALAVRMVTSTSNKESYVVDLPAFELTDGKPNVSGKNQDVTLDSNYQAFVHPTLGYTVGMNRFWFTP